MFRLASIIYSIASTSLAGSFFIAALVSGYDTQTPIIIAVVAGFILAAPLSWFVAKKILENS